MNRKVVHIDEDLCNGCGLCVPGCAEGALRVIDGKARLLAENLCDGLGACLGQCPRGAITMQVRQADDFDGKAAERHLEGLGRQRAPEHEGRRHGAFECPSSRAFSVERPAAEGDAPAATASSELSHWPVKLQLVPPTAPFFRGRDLVVAADCAPVAYGGFHRRFLKGNAVVIQCPKFGEQSFVTDKLAAILVGGGVTGVTVVRMEVPCCGGLSRAVRTALEASGRPDLEVGEVVISARGEIISRQG